MRKDTTIITKMRHVLDLVHSGQVEKSADLQALLLAAEAEAFLEDFATDKQHKVRRVTMPDGYELTRSEGMYGYRLKGGSTLEWETTAYSARKAAWDHFDAYNDPDESGQAIDTTELTAGTPASAAVHRAMIDIAMIALDRHQRGFRAIELPWLIDDVQLVGGDVRKEAVVDHLVMLGFLEELPPDLPERGPTRAFCWIRNGVEE